MKSKGVGDEQETDSANEGSNNCNTDMNESKHACSAPEQRKNV